MNSKKAKAIRKQVYREATKDKKHNTKRLKHPDTGVIYVTEERRAYQDAKRTIKKNKIKMVKERKSDTGNN